jgi:hypothetical protein
MSVVLDYARRPRPVWLDKIWNYFKRRWWFFVWVGLTIAVWPFVRSVFKSPAPIGPRGADSYWRNLVRAAVVRTYEMEKDRDSIIFAIQYVEGHAFYRVSKADVLASRTMMVEEAKLFVSEKNDNWGRYHGYLKALTGQDFGTDEAAWDKWIVEHGVLPGGEDIYRQVIDAQSSYERMLGYSFSELDRERVLRECYLKEVKEAGRFTWKVNLALAVYTIAFIGVFRLRHGWWGPPKQS